MDHGSSDLDKGIEASWALKTAYDELEKCQSCSTEAHEPEARFLLPLSADETNRLKLAAQT
jgi:hypothetical protein